MENQLTYTAFENQKIVATGGLKDVAMKLKSQFPSGSTTSTILIFSDTTGKQMDLDLSGTESEVLDRLSVYLSSNSDQKPASGPGRPKLGVVAREVSLLPRHWEWLATQSGGASATLRRLIEDAMKQRKGTPSIKETQERTYKFMTALAGNFPNYEEALRALFAKDKKEFKRLIADWPTDIRNYSLKLAE